MGNKRTKAKAIPDIYDEKDDSRDLAPKQNEMVSDMPKKFMRLIKRVEKDKLPKEKKKDKNNKDTMNKVRSYNFKLDLLNYKKGMNLEKRPDETLKQFNRRVELTLGQGKSMFKDALTGKSKKKEKRKEKKELERLADIELMEEEASRKDFYKLKDNVKFGEVAMAPPTLKVKPKDRAKNRKDLIDKINKTKVSKTINNQPVNRQPVGPKVEKSPAQKRILEMERTKVVELYRKLKKERLEKQ